GGGGRPNDIAGTQAQGPGRSGRAAGPDHGGDFASVLWLDQFQLVRRDHANDRIGVVLVAAGNQLDFQTTGPARSHEHEGNFLVLRGQHDGEFQVLEVGPLVVADLGDDVPASRPGGPGG